MSERVRLVNQQMAFSQSHLQAARNGEAFMRRCQLQACKLQMYLMIHAYLAELAERSNLKWELLLGDVDNALELFGHQLQQQNKVSGDFAHLAELIRTQSPWPQWIELAKSAFFIGKNDLNSPLLAEASALSPDRKEIGLIASSNAAPKLSILTAPADIQIDLLSQMLDAFTDLIQQQRENKIEF
ncbi:MAG: hypothetical protein U1F46_16640 [Marinagarivorans sp.]